MTAPRRHREPGLLGPRDGCEYCVICDGEVLMRNRQLLTLDKEEIVARVGETMARLAQRVPSSRIQLYRP